MEYKVTCNSVVLLLLILDPYEDQFAKKKEEKKERVAKNELQRLRNIARAQKSKGALSVVVCHFIHQRYSPGQYCILLEKAELC